MPKINFATPVQVTRLLEKGHTVTLNYQGLIAERIVKTITPLGRNTYKVESQHGEYFEGEVGLDKVQEMLYGLYHFGHEVTAEYEESQGD